MSNLFRGYAQKTDFSGNLLKGVDPSDRILEEGKRHLSQWDKVSQGEQQNQERYLAGLEAKFQAEEADRARNKKLEEYFAEGWKEALAKRHDGLLQNVKAKKSKAEQLHEKLQGWSSKAAEIGTKAAAAHIQAQQDLGIDLGLQFGGSLKQAKSIQTVQGAIDENYTGNNAAVWDLRQKGASWDHIQQIQKLGVWSKFGFKKGVARGIGRDYNTHLQGKMYEKIEGLGVPYNTLAAAINDNNLEAIKVIQQSISRDYLKNASDQTGLRNDFIIKYARDDINRINGRTVSKSEENRISQAQAQSQGERVFAHAEDVKEDAQASWNRLEPLFGGKGENTLNVVNGWINDSLEGFEKGLLMETDLERIKNIEIKKDGVTRSFENTWPNKIKLLKDGLDKRVARDIEQINLKKRYRKSEEIKASILTKDHLDNLDERLPSSQIAAMVAKADKTWGAGNEVSKVLTSHATDHVSVANDKIFEPDLERLQQLGLVTVATVRSMNLTGDTHKKWMKIAKEQDPFQPTKDEVKILEEIVNTKINDALNEFDEEAEDVSSSALALYTAKNKIKSYFISAAKDSTLTRAQMLARAQSEFEVDFAKDYKLTEFRTVNGVQIRDPQFTKFVVSAQRHPVAMSELTAEEVAANPNLPYEKLLFDTPVPVVKFWKDISQGRDSGYPAEARQYVSKVGIGPNGEVKITELMFMEAQMKLIDPKFEIPKELKQMHKLGMEQILPEWWKHMVGEHATPESLEAAISYGHKNGTGLQHKDLPSSENYADQNTGKYTDLLEKSNPVRIKQNYHAYLNIESIPERDLIEGYYGRA